MRINLIAEKEGKMFFFKTKKVPENPKKSAENDFEFPEMQEDFEMHFSSDKNTKEAADAKEEIKSAIEKIKKANKVDEIPAIKDKINKARECLMKCDLNSARSDYLDIIKVYSEMPHEEQAKVYNDIRKLYAERKETEEMDL